MEEKEWRDMANVRWIILIKLRHFKMGWLELFKVWHRRKEISMIKIIDRNVCVDNA